MEVTTVQETNQAYQDQIVLSKGSSYTYYALDKVLPADQLIKVPYAMRIILEAVVRNYDGFTVTKDDVATMMDWKASSKAEKGVAFKPGRVLLQDFTGVPCVVDLAAMRDAVVGLGGDPKKINPLVPVDLVVDHSVSVDHHGDIEALGKNEALEFERNKERFSFLKWFQKAFKNVRVVPPGSGIVHQVNLEYLARVVFNEEGVMHPDSVVGTDSHTTMIAGIGVLGWGVGGIEAEAVMLGQPLGMVVPPVYGFYLEGHLPADATATDLVLKIAELTRQKKVVGTIVEFYGPGAKSLSIADRATVSNMSPEFGATVAYFPMDERSFEYLRQTGRDAQALDDAEQYLKKNHLFREDCGEEIDYSDRDLRLDLSTVRPAVAGPKRPHDYVAIADLHRLFPQWLTHPAGFRGYGLEENQLKQEVPFEYNGKQYKLRHGSVVLAAITSCTNTSNPWSMIGAGLVAKKAVQAGLRPAPYIKCSLSPGSHVVQKYLKLSGLLGALEKLGFYLCGYGCQTCIGNSGDLVDVVADAIHENEIVAAAVLSGNRNFEGRINPLTAANFLASPGLVVVFALAGKCDIDFQTQPLGRDTNGNDVYMKDIWPSKEEIDECVLKYVKAEMYNEVYSKISEGNDEWKSLDCEAGSISQYKWNSKSTYVHQPPFFLSMKRTPEPVKPITKAFALLNLGDSITTDHISPAGKIAANSPAAEFLKQRNVQPRFYNSYGSRRGNDEIMVRGAFGNIRLVNKMASKVGPLTVHVPSGEEDFVYNVAMKYVGAGQDTVILAGKEYGCGSSRDWAAKGSLLLGVRAVIAQSYERIHRSNLVGMGVLPLQFLNDDNADSLGLTGKERFTIEGNVNKVGAIFTVRAYDQNDKEIKQFSTRSRIDAPVEVAYYINGGILPFVMRNLLQA